MLIILAFYNVDGFNLSKKRIKMFGYFREKIANNGILFLQETHSSYDTMTIWCHDFNGELFFFTWNNKFMRHYDWIFG